MIDYGIKYKSVINPIELSTPTQQDTYYLQDDQNLDIEQQQNPIQYYPVFQNDAQDIEFENVSVQQEQNQDYSQNQNQFDFNKLKTTTIEDIFKAAGLTHINNRRIIMGNPNIRPQNASYGARNSNHKTRGADGTANARDISIENGDIKDYEELKRQILSNPLIMAGLQAKGWGILNEVTPEILSRTNGTGKHFHLGPDSSAIRTLKYWIENPSTPVTKYIRAYNGTKLVPMHKSGDFLDRANDFVSNLESPVANAGLALSGAGFLGALAPSFKGVSNFISRTPLKRFIPIVGPALTATSVASAVIDGIQSAKAWRDVYNEGWDKHADSAIKNTIELVLSATGIGLSKSVLKEVTGKRVVSEVKARVEKELSNSRFTSWDFMKNPLPIWKVVLYTTQKILDTYVNYDNAVHPNEPKYTISQPKDEQKGIQKDSIESTAPTHTPNQQQQPKYKHLEYTE